MCCVFIPLCVLCVHVSVCDCVRACVPWQLIMGKMMEPGPVLIISFSAQQLTKVVNKTGEVVEGGDVRNFMKL